MTADRAARVQRWFDDTAYLLEKEDRAWLVSHILRDATREQAALLRKVDELERQVLFNFGLRRHRHEPGRLELGEFWDGASGNGRTWFTSKKAEREYILKQARSNGREA